MLRQFATIVLLLLAPRIAVRAQDAPTTQQPAQQSAGQQPAAPGDENSEEESTSRRHRPREYKKWTFNLGGGGNLPSGTTQKFVRGGGAVAQAGVARNYSKFFGFRLDFEWADLPLRTSALQQAQAPGATSHVYALMLDPIFNIPVTQKYSGYFVVGPGYYHRSGSLDSSTVVPGSACNPFFAWWGTCFAASLPVNGKFLKENQNELGLNVGGGIARKIHGNVEIYGEFRYLRGSRNNITTDVRPVTVGIRW